MRFMVLVAGRVADATRNSWRNIWRNRGRNSGRPSLATVIMFGGADLESARPGRPAGPFGAPTTATVVWCGADKPAGRPPRG